MFLISVVYSFFSNSNLLMSIDISNFSIYMGDDWGRQVNIWSFIQNFPNLWISFQYLWKMHWNKYRQTIGSVVLETVPLILITFCPFFFFFFFVYSKILGKHAEMCKIKEYAIKRIFSDFNNIFLQHESEDINKKAYFQNFSWFQFYSSKLWMGWLCVFHCFHSLLSWLCWIKSGVRDFLWKLLSFHTDMISA